MNSASYPRSFKMCDGKPTLLRGSRPLPMLKPSSGLRGIETGSEKRKARGPKRVSLLSARPPERGRVMPSSHQTASALLRGHPASFE
jgi:hypothetical protein